MSDCSDGPMRAGLDALATTRGSIPPDGRARKPEDAAPTYDLAGLGQALDRHLKDEPVDAAIDRGEGVHPAARGDATDPQDGAAGPAEPYGKPYLDLIREARFRFAGPSDPSVRTVRMVTHRCGPLRFYATIADDGTLESVELHDSDESVLLHADGLAELRRFLALLP